MFFFGSDSMLSGLVLKQLCTRHPRLVRAIHLSAPKQDIPNLPVVTGGTGSPSAVGLEYDIPVFARPEPVISTGIAAQTRRPLLLSVCYPALLPAVLLSRFRLALNLHPSRLPAYRGPTPLFWQLRDGLEQIGVTLHHLSDELDAGAVCLQQSVRLALEDTRERIERKIATVGVELIERLLDLLADDRPVPEIAQPTLGAASRQGFPRAQDYHLRLDWPAARVYRFTRGAVSFTARLPFRLQCDERQTLHLGAAAAIVPHPAAGPDRLYSIDTQENLCIRFADAGVVFDSDNYRFGAPGNDRAD